MTEVKRKTTTGTMRTSSGTAGVGRGDMMTITLSGGARVFYRVESVTSETAITLKRASWWWRVWCRVWCRLCALAAVCRVLLHASWLLLGFWVKAAGLWMRYRLRGLWRR